MKLLRHIWFFLGSFREAFGGIDGAHPLCQNQVLAWQFQCMIGYLHCTVTRSALQQATRGAKAGKKPWLGGIGFEWILDREIRGEVFSTSELSLLSLFKSTTMEEAIQLAMMSIFHTPKISYVDKMTRQWRRFPLFWSEYTYCPWV